MSPPKDNAIVPRTPDRRSSTHALFTAFRNLTGGRLRSPTPPPSTPSFASTPTPTSSTTRLPQRIAQPVLGGPPELEGLVAQLDSGNAFPERAAAIEEICKILQTYPISNVLGLWSVASDLLLPEQPDEVAEAGYKLLKNCVSWPKLSAIERSVFFDAVFLRDKDRYFDRRLQVINILTKRGRDIDACESAIIPFIISSLDACYRASHAAQKANKAHGKHGADKPTLEAQNLAHVLQYAIDICRFNAKIFTDGDLELLLGRAVNICQRTMDPGDLENCIKLFDTVNTYVHIPKGAMGSCVEVLCTVSGLKGDNDPLKDRSWSTLKNLLQSHIGGAAVLSLLHILFRGAAPPKERPSQNALKGTYVVLRTLLLDDGHSGLPTVPMALLCPALRASMTALLQPHDGMVVGLVDIVLSHDILRDQLFGETDVGDFVDLMCICMERDAESRRGRVKGTDKSSTTAAKHVDDGTTSLEKQRAFRNDAGSPSPSVSSSTHADDEKRLRSKTPEQSLRYADADFRSSDNPIFQVLVKLDNASDALDFVKKEALVQMFLRHPQRLGDSSVEKLIRHLAKERYLNPAHGAWLEICRNIVNGIAKDGSRPQSVRILAIQSIRKTYETVERLCATEEVAQCRALLLDHVQIEDDLEVLHELVDFAVHVADRAAFTEFSDVVRLLKARLDRPESSAITSPPHWPSQYPVLKRNAHFGSPCNIVATAFVRLFIRSVAGAASKTRTLYEVLREIAGNDRYANDARLSALKLLFRLRADARHAVTISSSSEGQRIAAELCRTADTAVAPDMADQGQPTDRGKPEESNTRTEQRKISGSSPHSSLNRNTSRTATSGRVSKPIPPLWMYPGPKGLPEEPIADPSRVVFSHIDASKYPLSDDVLDMEITLWLELIIRLLQRPPDWEIYSYVLVHLGPQLSNQALVRSCVAQLKMLRNVLCEQVRNASFHEPPAFTSLKKADVAVCLFHVLTVIISYHEYFEKSEEDDIVKSFLQGIVQWDRTSKWCIHALSVCCFELPLSISKSLDSIVQKMSQIITKPATAIHILEFLTSLARLPDLYKNFREDEFKTVFGVCFRYLQHIRDQRDRVAHSTSMQNGARTLRPSGASRDFAALPDTHTTKMRTIEDDMPHYLYSLAYHVITFWFMALKMEDRPKQIPWITKNLYYTDPSGKQIMEEQAEVILDIMSMVAYTDRDQTLRDENFAKPGDGEIWKKTWVVGNSLISIETAARTGLSLVTTRRPCGTRFLTIRPLLAPPPRHQVPITVGLASEAFYSSSYVGVLPEDIFQSFYAPLHLSNPPVPLPDDDMTRRAVSSFDMIATVDSYKVGVIYIGEGQTKERDIFMNSIGSPAYTAFVSDLGTLCRLKGATFNTGGLDTRNDQNGEFTYCWRDRCMEIVFHITTMMPTDINDEMTYPNKKQHIGNDFVNIIFNDSGLPYDFDTFPSAFNYVHIVISPESRASFVDRRLDADPDGRNRYYKVQAISRADFPDVSPAVETKILCGKHLAGYCRLIAINACVFSEVWSARDGRETSSSWRNRLRQIKTLRERYGGNTSDHNVAASPALSSPSSPPSRDANANGISPFHQRMSIATHTDTASRSSISSSSHDV